MVVTGACGSVVGGDVVISVCCGVKWLRRSAGCKEVKKSGILMCLCRLALVVTYGLGQGIV